MCPCAWAIAAPDARAGPFADIPISRFVAQLKTHAASRAAAERKQAAMCIDCRATSRVLDHLWDDPDFRAAFTREGYDLGKLAPLLHDVFAPAYRRARRSLEGGQLEMLEAQVTESILAPLSDQPNFRELWREWSQRERSEFLRENAEMALGQRLAEAYPTLFIDAYLDAFRAYLRRG